MVLVSIWSDGKHALSKGTVAVSGTPLGIDGTVLLVDALFFCRQPANEAQIVTPRLLQILDKKKVNSFPFYSNFSPGICVSIYSH